MKNNQLPEVRFPEFKDAWEMRKLGEISKLSSSKRIHLSDYVKKGIPFYRGSEISTGGITGNEELFISDGLYQEIKEKYGVPKINDLLVTAVGTLGNIWMVDNREFYYKDGNLIQISQLNADSNYVFSYFKDSIGKKRLIASAAGSNQKALTMVKMKEVKIPLSNIEEQQKIGSFFKKFDDTIALHQHQLNILKQTKQGFLQKMFPREGESVPELRFPGFADDWEQRKLGEVGYFYYGKSAPKWSVTDDAKTPCVRYGELYTKYGAKISNIYSRTNIEPKNLKFSTGNEVLVPRVGEKPLDFSLCSWLSIPNVAIGEMISVYNTKENPLFISYYFRSQLTYEFAKRVEGGNVSNLYYSYLEDINLVIPKYNEQIAISNFFEQLDDTIALHQRELEILKNTKKAFLQKMFV
ncbi:MAG: restriction endonuclease subunit S [Carnobacterium maltaromaticum]